MKLFQTTIKVLAHFGLHRSKAFETIKNINIKTTVSLFFLCQFTTSSVVFFVFKARSYREYADSFYMTTTLLCGGANIVMLVLRADHLFTMFATYENAVQKRKYMHRKMDSSRVI